LGVALLKGGRAMNFEFNTLENFINPFEFDAEQELKVTGKSVTYTEESKKLIEEIFSKADELFKNGFEPEFLLMNQRNYERLVGHLAYYHYPSPPDEFHGMKIVVWDLPCDFINIRCKASTEWAYGGAFNGSRDEK
jgi:hypothetical protein